MTCASHNNEKPAAHIKMIAVDLDGTLLRTDKTISDYTKSTLARLRGAGVKIVYATARGFSAERLAPSELFDGRVNMGGALAYIGNEVVYKKFIPYMTSRPLLIACDKRGLKATSDTTGMLYANFPVPEVWPSITYYEIVDFATLEVDAEKLCICIDEPRSDDGDATAMSDGAGVADGDATVMSVGAGVADSDVAFIRRHLPDSLRMAVTNDAIAMIMHNDATKSKAVAELAQIWGISQSEIAAFGDDLIDIDMLAYAGIGVAMENAHGAVKTVANCICKSNDDDGVARWLDSNM